jgi:hypothetical protein
VKSAFLFLFAVLLLHASAYGASSERHIQYPHVTVERSLQCGTTTFKLKTDFEVIDEETGHVVSQLLAFEKVGSPSREFLFKYKHAAQAGPDDSMITKASCVDLGNLKVIALESTDFGNCRGCEWADYFTQEGAYRGSTREIFGAVNFKYKVAADRLVTEVDKQMRAPGVVSSFSLYRDMR